MFAHIGTSNKDVLLFIGPLFKLYPSTNKATHIRNKHPRTAEFIPHTSRNITLIYLGNFLKTIYLVDDFATPSSSVFVFFFPPLFFRTRVGLWRRVFDSGTRFICALPRQILQHHAPYTIKKGPINIIAGRIWSENIPTIAKDNL